MTDAKAKAAARVEAIRARQRALKAELAARKPRSRRGPDPVRWMLGVLVVVLALLLLLQSCREEEPVASEACPPCDECDGQGDAPGETSPDGQADGRIEPRGRPAYRNPPPPPIPWLDELRLQVGSRSPRLAECFVGAERPGALKWTASVQPEDGRVADAELQPLLSGDTLTTAQRRCVLAVLEDPPYELDHDGERSTPPRVSVVIEF